MVVPQRGKGGVGIVLEYVWETVRYVVKLPKRWVANEKLRVRSSSK